MIKPVTLYKYGDCVKLNFSKQLFTVNLIYQEQALLQYEIAGRLKIAGWYNFSELTKE